MGMISFPPELKPGVRVWTDTGFVDHGPLEGPWQNIEGPQGGKIASETKPYGAFDSSLYFINWDNGQSSKHYSRDLIPIEDSKHLQDFLQRFEFVGEVTVKVGPRGGFKEVSYKVVYDGQDLAGNTRNRQIWIRLMEPAAERQGVKIVEIPLE